MCYFRIMRILFSFLLIAGIVSTAFSQGKSKTAITPIVSSAILQDTNTLKLRDYLNKNQLPYNGMPNVITQKSLPSAYHGNNNKGFDIYESRVDNMPMLVPDSSNAASLSFSTTIEETNTTRSRFYKLPRNKFDELLEKQKARDSLFIKLVQPRTFRYPKK